MSTYRYVMIDTAEHLRNYDGDFLAAFGEAEEETDVSKIEVARAVLNDDATGEPRSDQWTIVVYYGGWQRAVALPEPGWSWTDATSIEDAIERILGIDGKQMLP